MKCPLATVLSALCLSACDRYCTFADRVPHDLIAQTWTLRHVNDYFVPIGTDHSATLRFKNDYRIEGTATCNTVSSPERWWNVLGYEFHVEWPGSEYRWSADASGRAGRFTPSDLVTTAVGCGNKAAARTSDAFWQKMRHAHRWSLHDRYLVIGFVDGSNAILTPISIEPEH